jgi:glutamate/tyrosine decarboxylase-like PLP-dependent enzyme
MIDKGAYQQTAELERRCVAMLADLWHAPTPQDATGCSAIGSSKACMLAGMALHRRWAVRVDDRSRRPNLALVYPGVGWVLWRDAAALPQERILNVNYLGGNMPTFALDFSRPGSEVIAPCYTSARLGRSGFTAVQQAARDSAMFLAREIEALPELRLLSRGDIGRSPPCATTASAPTSASCSSTTCAGPSNSSTTSTRYRPAAALRASATSWPQAASRAARAPWAV